MILEAEAAAYHEPHFAKHGAEYGAGHRGLVETGLTRAGDGVRARRPRAPPRSARTRRRCSRRYDALISPDRARAARRAGSRGRATRSLCAPWSYAGLPAITLAERRSPRSGLPHRRPARQARRSAEILLYFAAWCEKVLGFMPGPVVLGEPPHARSEDRGRAGHRRHRRGRARAPTSASATNDRRRRRSHREHAGRIAASPRARSLAPGFIDMHSHSDWRLWEQPARGVEDPPGRHHRGRRQLRLLAGAVSRRVPGRSARLRAPRPGGHGLPWRSLRRLPERFDASGLALNVASSSATARCASPRWASRAARRPRPSSATMRCCSPTAMDDGAFGLSTGLIYAPGSYATTDEIVEVAHAARARHAGSTRATCAAKAPRSWTRSREAITVGREATCRSRSATSRPRAGRTGARWPTRSR